jgi:hypothetical protein
MKSKRSGKSRAVLETPLQRAARLLVTSIEVEGAAHAAKERALLEALAPSTAAEGN